MTNYCDTDKNLKYIPVYLFTFAYQYRRTVPNAQNFTSCFSCQSHQENCTQPMFSHYTMRGNEISPENKHHVALQPLADIDDNI